VKNFQRFAWFNVAFCLFVILWGAFVRATGSGAGCGAHWPLCNGEVMPLAQRIATMIEYTHRLTSGLSLVFVILLYFLSKKYFAKASFQRRAAFASLIAIFVEALIGAFIVLLRLVEHDKSLDRAISISFHLVNTLFLMASLTLTAVSATERAPRWKLPVKFGAWPVLVSFALLGALGALTALGDTLFPVTNLGDEWSQKLSSRQHFLQEIRVFHPILAVLWAGYLWYWLAGLWEIVPSVQKRSHILLGLVAGQLAFGMLNVLLLAPVWAQIVHLAIANAIWILLVTIVFYAATGWRNQPISGISKAT
jgi:cytochrome c oxidase assembly protein subunit 15